jgi:O-antigen biosynthesis protein WbqP
MLKRCFAIIFASFLMPFCILLYLFIGIGIKLISPGPIIHWSKRIGKNGKIFMMPKFRTMIVGTPNIASNKLIEPENYVTDFGKFLRLSSLDELPQVYSILIGDMSFVGPRPALFNQSELIKLRKKMGVDILVPGITGWAQVNGRDDISTKKKVALDLIYLNHQSLLFDLKILAMTLWKVIRWKGVSH